MKLQVWVGLPSFFLLKGHLEYLRLSSSSYTPQVKRGVVIFGLDSSVVGAISIIIPEFAEGFDLHPNLVAGIFGS